GLRGDDADGLTDVDQLAGGQRAAVALGAGAGAGLAGEHGAHLDLGDAGLDQLGDLDVAQVVAGVGEDLARLRVRDVAGRRAGVRRGLGVLVLADDTVGADDADHLRQATLGATVVLTDDDV